MKQAVSYLELKGTHKEVGRQIARKLNAQGLRMPAPAYFTKQDMKDAMAIYEKYCPGIKEELEGFAEEAHMEVEEIAYSWMSYLIPRCSGMVLLGSKNTDGHTRLARSYEFSLEDEDLTLCRTQIEGKYAHIGGSVAFFGRNEGINECGLAVSMSSCGIPVSNIATMNAPKIKGLQFWAVIRSLLENCKDVEEALKLAVEMPIAFNINLYLADAKGNGVLLETMNGHKAYKQISELTEEKYVYGANHIVLPELIQYEPAGMHNSIVRQEKMAEFLKTSKQLEETKLRSFLTSRYPEGMAANYYKDWFGTIKSAVMDTVEKRFSLCWFGEESNGWEDYYVAEPMKERVEEKEIMIEQASPEFFAFEPINN